MDFSDTRSIITQKKSACHILNGPGVKLSWWYAFRIVDAEARTVVPNCQGIRFGTCSELSTCCAVYLRHENHINAHRLVQQHGKLSCFSHILPLLWFVHLVPTEHTRGTWFWFRGPINTHTRLSTACRRSQGWMTGCCALFTRRSRYSVALKMS